MIVKEERNKIYQQSLVTMKEEYIEVKELYEQYRTREYLLRKTISYIEYILEEPDKCTFHLLTPEEEKLRATHGRKS